MKITKLLLVVLGLSTTLLAKDPGSDSEAYEEVDEKFDHEDDEGTTVRKSPLDNFVYPESALWNGGVRSSDACGLVQKYFPSDRFSLYGKGIFLPEHENLLREATEVGVKDLPVLVPKLFGGIEALKNLTPDELNRRSLEILGGVQTIASKLQRQAGDLTNEQKAANYLIWAKVWAKVWVKVDALFFVSIRPYVYDELKTQVDDLVKAQINAQVKKQIDDEVIHKVSEQVRNNVWAKVSAQVDISVGPQVSTQVGAQAKALVHAALSTPTLGADYRKILDRALLPAIHYAFWFYYLVCVKMMESEVMVELSRDVSRQLNEQEVRDILAVPGSFAVPANPPAPVQTFIRDLSMLVR